MQQCKNRDGKEDSQYAEQTAAQYNAENDPDGADVERTGQELGLDKIGIQLLDDNQYRSGNQGGGKALGKPGNQSGKDGGNDGTEIGNQVERANQQRKQWCVFHLQNGENQKREDKNDEGIHQLTGDVKNDKFVDFTEIAGTEFALLFRKNGTGNPQKGLLEIGTVKEQIDGNDDSQKDVKQGTAKAHYPSCVAVDIVKTEPANEFV